MSNSVAYAMTPVETQDFRVATPDGNLFARRWTPGNGATFHRVPIILLHDSLGSVELWRDFPARLAAATGRRVVAYDRLGFGRSDPHPGKLGLDFVHDEARIFIPLLQAQLGIEGFVPFGHSVGGGMAVGCAARHPADCRGVVTEASQAYVADCTIAGLENARRAFSRPGQLDRLKKYHGDKAAWVLAAWLDNWLSPAFSGWSLDDDLQRIRCPLLVLHGDDDEYGTTIHPHRIAEKSAGPATVEILPGCGHLPHREQGGAVIDIVRRWLERIAD